VVTLVVHNRDPETSNIPLCLLLLWRRR